MHAKISSSAHGNDESQDCESKRQYDCHKTDSHEHRTQIELKWTATWAQYLFGRATRDFYHCRFPLVAPLLLARRTRVTKSQKHIYRLLARSAFGFAPTTSNRPPRRHHRAWPNA